MRHRARPNHPMRGFSIIEMLVALAISATLLAATLSALDASWRSYKHTTESASTHVVSRIVVHRLLAMIRTGSEFGPFPADFFDPAQNPVTTSTIEFVEGSLAGTDQITRIERRAVVGSPGEFELWYVRLDTTAAPPTIVVEYPLLTGLREALFIMEYEPGPRLRKATIDLTIAPNDADDLRIGVGPETPIIRLVASAVPRGLD